VAKRIKPRNQKDAPLRSPAWGTEKRVWEEANAKSNALTTEKLGCWTLDRSQGGCINREKQLKKIEQWGYG